jgi:hypothetical protein
MPFALLFLQSVLALFLISAGAAEALEIVPFNTTNQSPLVAVYGLPPIGPATVPGAGRSSAELRADLASNFTSHRRSGERILLDGETYRFALALRHGVGRQFEVGLEIPFILHRDGFLDSFIIGWHDALQLPQGGRDQAPRNRLAYSYEKDGRILIDQHKGREGFGDVRLTGAWQLRGREESESRALALRASLKLPTGDHDRLLGSGSTDLALWLSGSESFRGRSLALFAGAGTLLMSNGDILAEQQRHLVAFATLGGGWRPLSSLILKIQVDGHTAFFRNSELREFSDSLQLTIGGTLGLAKSLALDLAVTEDIVVNASPDVVFHLALRQSF